VKKLWVSRVVAAPPAVVWDLLVDVAAWPRWGPSVRAVSLDGERIKLGSRGVVETVGGFRLPFEVTAMDDGRAWSWTVGGIAATDHAVEPTPDGTRVSFGVPWVAAPYLGVCALALHRIERLTRQEVAR
jgi:uncharacterized protein YndB with AHSA1/START domain